MEFEELKRIQTLSKQLKKNALKITTIGLEKCCKYSLANLCNVCSSFFFLQMKPLRRFNPETVNPGFMSNLSQLTAKVSLDKKAAAYQIKVNLS